MNSSMPTNHHHDSNNQPYTTINHIVLKGTDTDTPAAVAAATTTSSSSTKGLTATFASVTEETSSDGALSARSSDNGQAYEVIEYDYDEDANIFRAGVGNNTTNNNNHN